MNVSDLKFKTGEPSGREILLIEGLSMFYKLTGLLHDGLAGRLVISRLDDAAARTLDPKVFAEFLCNNLEEVFELACVRIDGLSDALPAEDVPSSGSVMNSQLDKMWGEE
jgi:hypothetical protein